MVRQADMAMKSNKILQSIGLIVSLFLVESMAAEDPKAEPEPPKIPPVFHQIQPDIVTTFPKPGKSKRLGYISIQVQLAVPEKYLESIEKHEPLIQDALIIHFSSQTEDAIKSIEGREKLRTDALKLLQEALLVETGHENLPEDLLFTKYIWQ